jgi:hypothetical protein
VSDHKLPLDLQTNDEEKQGHQAVVYPVFAGEDEFRVVPGEADLCMYELKVRIGPR